MINVRLNNLFFFYFKILLFVSKKKMIKGEVKIFKYMYNIYLIC